MTIVRKDEEEWWFARHEDGRSGAIPVPYVNVVSGSIFAHTYTHTHRRRERERERDREGGREMGLYELYIIV